MADAVANQTIQDGPKTAIFRFTNVSDGTGESAVVKVDASALASDPVTKEACTSVSIECIWYTTVGMGVKILFDATADVLAWQLREDDSRTIDFRDFSGVPNNAGAGKTGDIAFTTVGAGVGDVYVVVLQVRKHYG
jgi:hypothetical protein